MNARAGPEGRPSDAAQGRPGWSWGCRAAAAIYVAWLAWLAVAVIIHMMN